MELVLSLRELGNEDKEGELEGSEIVSCTTKYTEQALLIGGCLKGGRVTRQEEKKKSALLEREKRK